MRRNKPRQDKPNNLILLFILPALHCSYGQPNRLNGGERGIPELLPLDILVQFSYVLYACTVLAAIVAGFSWAVARQNRTGPYLFFVGFGLLLLVVLSVGQQSSHHRSGPVATRRASALGAADRGGTVTPPSALPCRQKRPPHRQPGVRGNKSWAG